MTDRGTSTPLPFRCWCEIVHGRRHVADGCPTHDIGTQSGTSIPTKADDPQNAGKKPEDRENQPYWWEEVK